MKEFLEFVGFMIASLFKLIGLVILCSVGVILFTPDAMGIKLNNLMEQENKPAWETVYAIHFYCHAKFVECCSEIKTQIIMYKRQVFPKKKKV